MGGKEGGMLVFSGDDALYLSLLQWEVQEVHFLALPSLQPVSSQLADGPCLLRRVEQHHHWQLGAWLLMKSSDQGVV